MKRIKKDGISIIENEKNSVASCEFLNLILQIIRYHFIYSNFFYKINKSLSIIESIYSFLSIILLIFIYGTFEILFKQIYLINSSMNIYSYLLFLSLFTSFLFILLTNHCLFQFALLIYSQQQYQLSNQVKFSKNISSTLLFFIF